MPHIRELVHGAVIVTGSSDRLADMQSELREAFRTYHYRDNALLVEDVTAQELPKLDRFAGAYGCRVEQVRNSREVRVAAEDDEVKQPTPTKIDVSQGGWYKTNSDEFPLLHVIEIRNEVDPDGILLYLFDVDLVCPNALPHQATMDAAQLKGYSPKAASLKDFEDLDIAPPAGFDTEDPHVIPSVESDVADLENAPKTAGVSLPQAQIAAQQLQQRLGRRFCRAEAVKAQDGFVVEARLFGHPAAFLPDIVAGTPVKYR